MSEQPIMLGNRYRLDEIIGRGGMAEVWRAWDTRLGRDVAVKRLRVDLATDPTFQARFRREAQSAAGLNHPNIVAVYDTGAEVDPANGIDVPYIVMELVQGTTLRDLLRDGRQILPDRALEFTGGVLDALAYAHRRGIVHRDIKPANVMLTTTGRIKVMDFGIARAVAETSATMTQTAAVIGTAQYLSPEQARGETVDTRSDIYSVGCLLYELLTSRPPFVGDSPVSVAYQHVREQPVPPSRIDPELTQDMDTVVLTALAKDPVQRYQTAEAMRDDIQRLLDKEPPLGVASVPVEADATRVLSDRPAPGAHPRRGFTEVHPVPAGSAGVAAATTLLAPNDDDAFELDDDYDPDMLPAGADQPPPRHRLSPLVAVLIVLITMLLAGGVIMVYQVMKAPPEPTTTQVPALLNLTEQVAKQQISDASLTPMVVHQNGPDDKTKGTVISQNPDPQSVVQIGSTVTITVNIGPLMGTIPSDLVGLTESAAKQALAAASFTNVVSVTASAGTFEPPTAMAGDVLSIDPMPGLSVPLDTQITLTLASGQTAMPSVIKMTEADAISYLNGLGFTKVQVTHQMNGDVPAGTVFQQTPEAGTYAFRVNMVYIYIADAPPPPPPPTSVPPTIAPPDTGQPSDPGTNPT